MSPFTTVQDARFEDRLAFPIQHLCAVVIQERDVFLGLYLGDLGEVRIDMRTAARDGSTDVDVAVNEPIFVYLIEE